MAENSHNLRQFQFIGDKTDVAKDCHFAEPSVFARDRRRPTERLCLRPDRIHGRAWVAISSADFNGDGKIDIVTADQFGNQAVISFNGGAGTFPSCNLTPAGLGAFAVRAADLNGGGKPDLAVANTSDGRVSILLNQGTLAGGSCVTR